MSSIDELFGNSIASAELAAAAGSQDLVPAGRYPFTVQEVTATTPRETWDDGNANPLFGHPVARVQIVLRGVTAKGYDELDGKDRMFSFSVTPDKLVIKDRKGNDRLHTASKLAGDMIQVSGTAGKSFAETIKWFEEHAAQISISQFAPPGGKPMNMTNKITALA